jgi:uncharacterized protein (DUF58 family)
MVRREEQPWESRCTLLLDTRQDAHHGDGPDASFERAVSAAASASVHLSRRGYAVRLVTGAGPAVTGSPADDYSGAGADAEGLLLDALAVVSLERRMSIAGISSAIRHASDGLLLAVLGQLSADDADDLIRARHGMGTSVALVCEVGGWFEREPGKQQAAANSMRDAVGLLRSAGWVVAPIRREVPLSETWAYLAHGVELPIDLPMGPVTPSAEPVTSSQP